MASDDVTVEAAAFIAEVPSGITGTEAHADEILRQLDNDLESVRLPVTPSVVTPDFWPECSMNRAERDPSDCSWLQILPPLESEWDAERRQQQVFVKKLPRRIRRLVVRVVNTHQRGQTIDFVVNELTRRAAGQQRLFETTATDEVQAALRAPRVYAPGIDTETLLREMAADSAFTLRLFKLVKSVKKEARAVNTWVGVPLPEDLPRVHLPPSGTATVAGWLGLTVAPLPHRPPEGLLLGLAQRFWTHVGVEPRRSLRVLDWGAGNSPFTRGLAAINPRILPPHPGGDDEVPSISEVKIKVDEVDVLGDAPPELAFVNRTAAVLTGVAYDFVLIQLPPPCGGRGGHRDRHKGLPAGRSGQVAPRDLGRLGIRRWSRSAPAIVRRVLDDTRKCQGVAVLVPLFEIGTHAVDAVREQLIEVPRSVGEAVRNAGLAVTRDFEVGSTESLERWRCLIASSGTSPGRASGTAEDEIEAILRAIQ